MSEVKYGININMLGNRVDNSVLHYATTSPEALSTGQVWFDATNSLYKFWDGTNWTVIGSGTNAYWATLTGGTNTTPVYLQSAVATTNTITVVIRNGVNATTALNGTVAFSYVVVG